MVDADLRASMRQETALFMRDVLTKPGATIATMLSAPYSFVDPRLAALYGLPAAAGGFNLVATDPAQRSGLLTQASFLSIKPHATARGAWVLKKLLCLEILPPLASIDMPPVMPGPGQTYREAYQQTLTNPACAACHTTVDPPGFAFENYDPLGRYRVTDNGKPIDASGVIASFSDNQEIRFVNALDMGRQLAQSCDVQSCMAQVFLGQAVGGALRDSDAPSTAELMAAWVAAGFELRELLVLTTGTPSFLAP
jgi:hypothetical protein